MKKNVDNPLTLLYINTMNVIFGTPAAQALGNRMTILELDTFWQEGLAEPVTAYAVLENTDVPLQEFPVLKNHVDLHNTMMEEYRKQNWGYCEQALEHLPGRFGGELDSFYTEFGKRLQSLKTTKLPENWTGVVVSTVS